MIGFNEVKYKSLWRAVRNAKISGKTLNHLNTSWLKAIGLNEEDIKQLVDRIGGLRSKERSNSDICMICTENTINTAVVPCGHGSFCFPCSNAQTISNCPICQIAVTQIM